MRVLTLSFITVSLLLVPTPSGLGAQTDHPVDLSGDWLFNYELSDEPQSRMPAAVGDARPREPSGGIGGIGGGFGGRGGYGGRPGGYGRPQDPERREAGREQMAETREAMDDLLTAPRRMTIVQSPRELVLTYDDGRSVRLVPDDREHAGIAGNGVEVIRRTTWDEATLRAVIRLDGGPKVIHVLESRLDGEQLVVTTTVEPRGSFDGLEMRRVYDRSAVS